MIRAGSNEVHQPKKTNESNEWLLIEETLKNLLREVLSTAITIEIRKSPKAEVDRYVEETARQIISLVRKEVLEEIEEQIKHMSDINDCKLASSIESKSSSGRNRFGGAKNAFENILGVIAVMKGEEINL